MPHLILTCTKLFQFLQHLQQQQGALSQLVKVVKEDFEDLKCIEEGFTQT